VGHDPCACLDCWLIGDVDLDDKLTIEARERRKLPIEVQVSAARLGPMPRALTSR